jgi:predicted DNA-binding protein YlxM (UPF0122 family)
VNKALVFGSLGSIALITTLMVMDDSSQATQEQNKQSKKQIHSFVECSSGYDLNYFAKVAMKNEQFNFVQTVQSDLNATMGFRVFDVSDKEVKVGFYLDPRSYLINNRSQNPQGTKELFNHIVLAKMNPYGQVVDYEFPRDIHKDDEAIVMSLISPLQWNYSYEGNTTYNSVEVDVLGEYLSSYTSKEKVKHSYKAQDVKVVQSSLFSDILSHNCWHHNAQSNEILAYSAIPNRPAMRTQVHLDIAYQSTLDTQHPLMQVKDFDALWREYTQPSTVSQTVRERYLGASQMAQLQSHNISLQNILDKLKKGTKNQHTFEDQLLIYLLNDPTAFEAIQQDIANNLFDEYQMSVILRVIGKMNTPKAQIFLSEMMTGYSDNETYQLWAAIELGKQTTVIPDIVKERLLEQYNYAGVDGQDQRRVSAALYSLGSLADNLKSVDSEYVNSLNDELLSLLSGTSDSEKDKKAYILGALSNTGSDQFLDVGKEYIGDSDITLRKRALEIVSNNPSDDATVVLEKQFMQEEDNLIKSNLLDVLKDRVSQDATIHKDVISMAKNGTSKIVHDSTIDYLTYQLGPSDANRKVLVDLLKTESSQTNVYKLVQKINSMDKK